MCEGQTLRDGENKVGVQQGPQRWDHTISSHYQILITKRNCQEVMLSHRVRQDWATGLNWILSCQTPSKNNRCYLTSITEPLLLVPLTKHIYFYSWLSPLPSVKSLGGCHRQGLGSSSVLTGQLITDGGEEQAFQNPWWRLEVLHAADMSLP